MYFVQIYMHACVYLYTCMHMCPQREIAYTEAPLFILVSCLCSDSIGSGLCIAKPETNSE